MERVCVDSVIATRDGMDSFVSVEIVPGEFGGGLIKWGRILINFLLSGTTAWSVVEQIALIVTAGSVSATTDGPGSDAIAIP